VDVILSNAALQWVPGHRALFADLLDSVQPGGWFAFQVPGNFDAPSHVLLREVCQQPAWREKVGTAALRDPVAEPADYLRDLQALACDVDAWETTYLHVLEGEDPVLEWVRGSALRPVLAALDPELQPALLDEYRARLREAYPRRAEGTVLPFRRIFVVARKR
jgi:trans-aconitate 2-methyltransferase